MSITERLQEAATRLDAALEAEMWAQRRVEETKDALLVAEMKARVHGLPVEGGQVLAYADMGKNEAERQAVFGLALRERHYAEVKAAREAEDFLRVAVSSRKRAELAWQHARYLVQLLDHAPRQGWDE